MDRTRAVYDDTPQAPSPPNVPSKSTNIPPSMTKSADSGSRRPASGPTPQKRLSYAEMAKKGLNGAAGANPAVAPGQSSRRVTRPTGNPPATADSGATSRGRQLIAECTDASQSDNELGQRSRGGGQLSSDTDDTRNAPVHPISSSKPSDISASKQARTTQRDGVTNSAPVLSASSMRVRRSPSFRDASHSRASQETDSNIPPVPPRPEEAKTRSHAELVNRTTSVNPSVEPSTSPPSSSTPHERNATRSKADQVRRTASTQPSFKLSTPPPPPLKRPSASASPSPSSTAPVLTKMSSSRMHKDPSAIRYGLPVPPNSTPASNDPPRQGHEDPSDIPHRPPVPPKVDSTTTVPPLQGHRDFSTAIHIPPTPPERTTSRQDSQDPSATPPSSKAPLQQGHVDVSTTSHRHPTQHVDRTASVVLPPSRRGSSGNGRPLSCWTRFTRWCARCWNRFTRWCVRCCSCCKGSPVSPLSPEHVMEGLVANTR